MTVKIGAGPQAKQRQAFCLRIDDKKKKNDCSQVFNYLLPRFNLIAQGFVPYFAFVGHNCQKQLNCIHYNKTPCYL